MNPRLKRRANALPPGAPGSPLDNWIADHPYYVCVREWVWNHMNTISDPSVFVILGPTGAGKTTLVEDLQRQLTIRLRRAMQADPSLIPYVSGEAIYIPGSGVDWRGLFTEMLECADEILIDRKIEEPGDTPGTTPGLYRATIKMLNFRSPALAIVDEAAALVENTERKPETLKRNVNYLKGICNKGRTHLLLLGNYSLAGLAFSSAEIRRRCYFAHLAPYDSSPVLIFENIVKQFEGRLLAKGQKCELVGSTKELLEGTAGSVGLLHRWLNSAYLASQLKGRPITKSLLLETPLEAELVAGTRQQICAGAALAAKVAEKMKKRMFDPRSS